MPCGITGYGTEALSRDDVRHTRADAAAAAGRKLMMLADWLARAMPQYERRTRRPKVGDERKFICQRTCNEVRNCHSVDGIIARFVSSGVESFQQQHCHP